MLLQRKTKIEPDLRLASGRRSFLRATRSERKSKIMLSTYCGSRKNKRLLVVSEAINYTRNMISSLKVIFTSYFIDGRVFFRIFTFYVVFDDLSLN